MAATNKRVKVTAVTVSYNLPACYVYLQLRIDVPVWMHNFTHSKQWQKCAIALGQT